jgi:hypothetical protein
MPNPTWKQRLQRLRYPHGVVDLNNRMLLLAAGYFIVGGIALAFVFYVVNN